MVSVPRLVASFLTNAQRRSVYSCAQWSATKWAAIQAVNRTMVRPPELSQRHGIVWGREDRALTMRSSFEDTEELAGHPRRLA